jgi:hypothetical protein
MATECTDIASGLSILLILPYGSCSSLYYNIYNSANKPSRNMWNSNYMYLSMALQLFVAPRPLFSFLIFAQSVRLLGRRISPSQGRYLQTQYSTNTE